MSTRVDHRGKTQQQQNRPPVNGNVRLEDYEYNGHPTQIHPQPHPQQAPYNAAMQMSSPSTDSYMSAYYHQSMGFPTTGFFDTSAWSTSGADTFPYLNGYGQQVGSEYMQFPGFDYPAPNAFWSGYPQNPEYSWASASHQPDPTKILDGQSYIPPPMDQAYAETYHSPTGAHQKPMNGQDIPTATSEPTDVTELDQGIQTLSVNGHGDGNQSSPSETLHEPMANVNNSSVMPAPNSSAQSPVKTSWANVAKKPAKPVIIPPKILTRPQATKANHENNWDKGSSRGAPLQGQQQQQQRSNAWSAPRTQRNGPSVGTSDRSSNQRQQQTDRDDTESDPTLNKLKLSNAYNPKSFDISPKNARFFVIKSYSEDDIHRAIKYGVWCSTEHGNKRLDAAFKEREGKGPIYLFYSVNGSGHFCGMAQMMSGVDYQTHAGVWTQDKWKGSMEIKWIYVKDVPNSQLRHIRLENNENKPVTNSRDTQEVLPDKGKQVLKIIHTYRHSTSIFDDFGHYEKKEVEEGDSSDKKKPSPKLANGSRN